MPQLIGFVDLFCLLCSGWLTDILLTFCLKNLMYWFSDRDWFSYNRVQMIFLFKRTFSSSASPKYSLIGLIKHLSWQIIGGTCALLLLPVADHILDTEMADWLAVI